MEPRTSVIETRLKHIDRIIAVASGKGGVGKSLIASGLALHLARKSYRVGLLDLDLYGPSAHIILGANDAAPAEEKGLIPPRVHGVLFMSIVYFTKEKPSPFRGGDISNIILELLAITQWGPLDFLIVDMPPGIGDETLDVIHYMKRCEFLIVTTPSKVAMGAVSKLLRILLEIQQPMLGVIENMTMNDSTYIQDQVKELQVRYLGKICFDEDLEESIGDADHLLLTNAMKNLSAILQKNGL